MFKDISEFGLNEIATSFMSGISYKVKSFRFDIRKGKRQIVESKCVNTETGNEVRITWHKNKNFV